MSWQILTLISLTAYALAIITQRVVMKNDKSEPVSYSVVFQLLTGIFIGFFGLLTSGLPLPDLKPLAINLIIMTLLYGFGNIFTFKALKLIEASEFTIIFASRGLFTLIASSILLQEGLSPIQLIGAFLIMTSVVLVTIKSFKFNFSKGELLTILGAFCLGVAVTNDRYLLGSFEVIPYVTLAFILPALFIALANMKKMSHVKTLMRKDTLRKMLIMCFLYSISALTFFKALQIGTNSSQISILNLLSIILVVILGMIFLKERGHVVKKIIGAILSIIGSIILIR